MNNQIFQGWEFDDKEEAESDDEVFETPVKKKKKSVEIDDKKNKKMAKKSPKNFYEQDDSDTIDGDLEEIEPAENEYLNRPNAGGDRKRNRQSITTSTTETLAKLVKTEFPCDFCKWKFGAKANLEVKLQLKTL